jgi:hypothetical protein
LSVEEIETTQRSITGQRDQASEEYNQLATEISQIEGFCRVLRLQFDDAGQLVTQHQSNKPGLLAWIATLGRSHRQWWGRHHQLTQELDRVRHELSSPMRSLQQMKVKQNKLHSCITERERDLQLMDGTLAKLKAELSVAAIQLDTAQINLGDAWPDPRAADDAREKSSPWVLEDWRKAREAQFLAALDIHLAFIENHPKEFLRNINLASDWLQGKDLPEEAAIIALESLCLVVPVISTTFASIPRMFKQIGQEGISWLLIDKQASFVGS